MNSCNLTNDGRQHTIFMVVLFHDKVSYSKISNTFYCRDCVRHLVVRSGEQIDIPPLIIKRVHPRKDSAVCHHL